jgi:hypothetical protein
LAGRPSYAGHGLPTGLRPLGKLQGIYSAPPRPGTAPPFMAETRGPRKRSRRRSAPARRAGLPACYVQASRRRLRQRPGPLQHTSV